jgi:hypothetical protein
MKRLLLQAAKSSLFLRRPEGRRFLAHVLTLHPSLVAEVASVMRNMVRRCLGGFEADGAAQLMGLRGLEDCMARQLRVIFGPGV